MLDYDVRPKPKVWTGSPNECRTFARTSAECFILGWNSVLYWGAHCVFRNCHSKYACEHAGIVWDGKLCKKNFRVSSMNKID